MYCLLILSDYVRLVRLVRLFLHIYISLFSEVHCSLILRFRLLPKGPEGGPLTQNWGLRDRLSQLKFLDNLDNSDHGCCTAHCLRQTGLESCMTKTDMQICRQGAHITELELDQYSSWSLCPTLFTYLFSNNVGGFLSTNSLFKGRNVMQFAYI